MSSPVTPPLTVSDTKDGGSVTGRPITDLQVTDGTLTVSGRTATLTTGGGGGSGTVTSIATSAPITGGTITTSGTIGITQSATAADGYLSSTDWNTFNNKGSGDGDVTATGTPVDNQLAVWDSATSIEGDANLTWDGSTLTVSGALVADNIKIDGYTISSDDTNGAIDLSPDGTGVVTMYNAYRFPTAVTTTNDYVLTAQTDGTTAWAEVSGGSVPDPLKLSDGDASAPSYSFTSDTDTGIYLTGAGILSCATGGVENLRTSTSGIQAIPAGSAAVPSISFAADTDTGLFHTGTNEIGFVTGGTERLAIGSSGELLVGGSAAGDDGQVLTSGGSGAAVAWEAAGGGGTQYAIVPPDAQSGLSATYGNFSPIDRICTHTTTITNTTAPDYLSLFPFTAPVDGTMGAITVRTDTTHTTQDDISISIYSTDSNGLPTTRMGVVDIDVDGGANLYSSSSWDSSPTLTAGETYFFGCVSAGGSNPTLSTRNLTGSSSGALLGVLGFTHYAGTMYVGLRYDTVNTTPATIDPATELTGLNTTMLVWTYVNT